ncbi:copper resistance CopC family protein [Microbacterium sp.]|uniref:copper resistance CopC family protein n=1 Tax=Microbacterium sp. TaxID=51671 RepID=UPI0028122FFB|nr:copper resistance protein CopC [Microbacterium sp.]
MSRIRTALAGLTVAAVAVLAAASPASAHDALVSSTPAAGEQLAAAPEQIVLTFSNTLIAVEEEADGTAVVVADESGRDWAAGDPVVDGDTVTVPLEEGMPAGSYRVTWQVVSSDGHPTSGEYDFTVAGETASDGPSAPADEPTADEPSPAATDPAAQDAGTPWPLIGLGVLLLAAAATLMTIAARRRR